MVRRSQLFTAVVLASLVALAGIAPRDVGAQQPTTTTLRFAVLAPRGSTWHRVFTAWGNSLRTRTNGQLTIQVESVSPGDEPALVRRIRAGELDGACLTAVGIGEIAQSALVLQAPGVYDDYAPLDRARAAMDSELRAIFAQNGVVLMGWADYGRGRIFSTRPIAQPSDFRQAHTWTLPNDPMSAEFLRAVGGTGVPLPIGQVMAGLNDGRIDTVVASATAVSALQWHTRLTHVSSQASTVLVGGTFLSKARFDALSPALQEALVVTGAQAHTALQTAVRRDDDRFYEALTTRHGMTPVDVTPHRAQWQQIAQRARDAMVGRLYTRELLDRALAAAR